MEQVLEVYARPYDENHPVVCLDESPKQLIEQSRPTYKDEKGEVHQDYEYIRHGVRDLYMITEPLGARREVLVKPNHNSQTYAEVLAHIAENMYPDQDQVTLIEVNLSAHRMAALYEVFPPPERARKIARKFQVVLQAWDNRRNQQQKGVNWHFTTQDARIKLKRLCPLIET